MTTSFSVGSRAFATFAAAISLALAGCDSSGGGGGGDVADEPAPEFELATGSAAMSAEALAQLRARVDAAMRGVLLRPLSANYTNLRNGASGSVCGQVAEGAEGAPRPFLVTPDGNGFVSATPALALNDPDDAFPDLYMQYCATAEELSRMGRSLETMVPAPGSAVPPAIPMPPVAQGEEEGEVDVTEPGPPPPPARPRARPRGNDDSFFNSVWRPDAE